MTTLPPTPRPAPGLLACRAWAAALLCAAAFLLSAAPARAIPAFARKYQTSCLTCHVIFPKLNPFGEAFRRNGYRFPGVDTDFIKQETVPLGNEAQKAMFPKSVWPGLLMASVPIAVGFNGQGVIHPDKNAGAAQADNGSWFTLHDLALEGHIWAGGSFTERNTFFGELTVGSDGTIDLENAYVLFNDLFGLHHGINLIVGKRIGTLTSFGPHSSYLADTLVTPLSVTALYGATSDSWNVTDNYPGIEVNGMIGGRFIYSAGLNAGANLDIRTTQNTYAHVGLKLGGVRLDGENGSHVPDPMRPWEETALTVDAFFYRAASHFTNPQIMDLAMTHAGDDTAYAFGGSLRLQIRSFELNSGAYQERHDHAQANGNGVNALAQFNELSYVVFPWLVPAARVEYIRLEPQGDQANTDVRLIAGVHALILTNLRLLVSGQLEYAIGAPPGGWSPSNGFAAPVAVMPGMLPKTAGPEVESIQLQLAYAF